MPPPREILDVANAVSLISAAGRDPRPLEQTLKAGFWKALAEATATCAAFAAKTGRAGAEPALATLARHVKAKKRAPMQKAAAAAVTALGLG